MGADYDGISIHISRHERNMNSALNSSYGPWLVNVNTVSVNTRLYEHIALQDHLS